MLGLNALGRLALGQLSDSGATVALAAVTGTFALSGVATAFIVSQFSSVGSYAVTGNAAPFVTGMTPAVGGYSVTVNNALLNISMLSVSGSYLVTVYNAILGTPVPQPARRPLYIEGVSYWKGRQ